MILNSHGKLVRFIDQMMQALERMKLQPGIWIDFDANTIVSAVVLSVILPLSYYSIHVQIKHTNVPFYSNKTNKIYNTNTMQLTCVILNKNYHLKMSFQSIIAKVFSCIFYSLIRHTQMNAFYHSILRNLIRNYR